MFKSAFILIMALMVISLEAQTTSEVRYIGSPYSTPLKFFNTNGVQAKRFTLYGSTGTVADTMVSQIIPNDGGDIEGALAMSTDTDTMHANFYYQPIYGVLSDSGVSGLAYNKGFYRMGAGALSTIADSINVLGVRGGGVAGTTKSFAGIHIPADVYSGNTQTTTSSGYNDARDSTRTVTNTYNTAAKGVTGWRFVMISHPNKQDVTNATLFDNWFVTITRKKHLQ